MKKINRKGFTLVELLVVIVILAVIMSIAIPSVTSSIERSKQKQKDSKIEMVLSAAELYVDRHKNLYSDNTTYTISMLQIICDGLLTKEQVKDPFNEDYTLGMRISYTKNGNIYTWSENNVSPYRLEIDDVLICP